MNYLKVYCNLIRKAENRTLPEGYVEKHHIFPISIFGNNNGCGNTKFSFDCPGDGWKMGMK
jgi:hypothetical protein